MYLENPFKETYIKDIINGNKIRNELELEGLINILSSTIGPFINPWKLSNTIKSKKNVSIFEPTIKSYLDILADLFLIEKSGRYDENGKKILALR